MTSMINSERHGRVARITLDEPARGNSLSRAGVADLRRALAGLGKDVELIVLRGAGGRAFCGGVNSPEMVALPPEGRRESLTAFSEACLEIWDHPALSVAVLDGYAIGGGAHLAMSCDMRTMASDAFLQFPSSGYGLNITTVWITLAAGPATAAWLMGSARRVPALEAVRLGLAQVIAPGDGALAALGLEGRTGFLELKAAIREAIPRHVGAALREEAARARELVGLDRFVNALGQERSAKSGRK
ncbi:MAG: enoyl-CoA hydratase/isomerase family protein [Betaproteobacteria bacterium]|nr:enoyl-CoA hydratase/isomerase family protein [Betaproteobacteria bacterium]